MNDIQIMSDQAYGLGFVPAGYLAAGETEYRIRDEQLAAGSTGLGRSPGSYRKLRPAEIEALVKNGNTCKDWDLVFVTEPFAPELVKNCEFAGLVRIGRLDHVILAHHDMHIPAGLSDSRIIACDLGDNCAIHDCAYLAHYIVGDGCILVSNNEIYVSNHAKFGNGIVMEGESEAVRVSLDLMNEAGGRSVLPFDEMICADAYLWARRRGDTQLMERFKSMTESMYDRRRGRYGLIGRGSVLKSNRIIKDVCIGESCYIKGANKLKNLTIKSSEAERTQIGEGVELVNGIVGLGCKVFYGCKAVRFVMGPNSSLKYGARLIHSVLGDNSTVSCCEILNNLIFPAHEQHHNTSFLVASLVRGQSNMAAGATIGSNHNSRAPDGEIEAGRGFWPGLSTSVKHSSRFASYCLLGKGSYRFELDIKLPFCLVEDDPARDQLVLVPAYWWTHNLYALMRNERKFAARDRRITKTQHIEFAPLAPDTAEEIIGAIELLDGLLEGQGRAGDSSQAAAGLTAGCGEDPDIEVRGFENSRRPVFARRPRRALAAYREMLLWYAARVLLERLEKLETREECLDFIKYLEGPRERRWENLGGLLAPLPLVEELVAKLRSGELSDWRAVHKRYEALAAAYPDAKARHALAVLRWLDENTSRSAAVPGPEDLVMRSAAVPGPEGLVMRALADLPALAEKVGRGLRESRAKDFSNTFRRATFHDADEMRAVLGGPGDEGFVLQSAKDMALLAQRAAETQNKLRP